MESIDVPDRLQEVILDYVAGCLPYPAKILMDAHFEIVPENRDFLHNMESLAGCHLEEAPPAELRDGEGMLKRIMTEIDCIPMDEAPAPLGRLKEDQVLPRALRHYVGVSGDEIPWRTKVPGVKVFKLDQTDGCEVSLMKLRPGIAMPDHSHEGRELTLVLKGNFSDESGRYARGDVCLGDSSCNHKPVVGKREECICFVVNDAPLRFSHPFARIFSSILPN